MTFTVGALSCLVGQSMAAILVYLDRKVEEKDAIILVGRANEGEVQDVEN